MSSCHGCAQSFGFLKREIGCPNCKFSYCKKCLRFKLVDSKTSKEILVCHRCYTVANSKMDPEEPAIVTKALERLESMENPARPPITVYRQPAREARFAQLKKGLSIEDQHIADRLESLRRTDEKNDLNVGHRRSSEQIEEEIEARLARLKGEQPMAQGGAKSFSPLAKTKPETEADLIARYASEVELDNQYETKIVSDIESRLAKLRGDRPKDDDAGGNKESTSLSKKCDFEDEEISEEEQVKRIIDRFKAEVDLEAKTASPMDHEDESGATDTTAHTAADVSMSSDDDEDDIDNLCRICDEKRATLKCNECDGDLFCKNCFKELHIELGEVHRPVAYKT